MTQPPAYFTSLHPATRVFSITSPSHPPPSPPSLHPATRLPLHHFTQPPEFPALHQVTQPPALPYISSPNHPPCPTSVRPGNHPPSPASVHPASLEPVIIHSIRRYICGFPALTCISISLTLWPILPTNTPTYLSIQSPTRLISRHLSTRRCIRTTGLFKHTIVCSPSYLVSASAFIGPAIPPSVSRSPSGTDWCAVSV